MGVRVIVELGESLVVVMVTSLRQVCCFADLGNVVHRVDDTSQCRVDCDDEAFSVEVAAGVLACKGLEFFVPQRVAEVDKGMRNDGSLNATPSDELDTPGASRTGVPCAQDVSFRVDMTKKFAGGAGASKTNARLTSPSRKEGSQTP
ncbi:MAG: hypothetical protein ACI9KE_003041 [Polyangiales bacterium]|jgi:hypothetical protein